MADGYGVGLFDSAGPERFATSIKKIGTELGTVSEKFSDLATKAGAALGQVSSAIDELVSKLSGLSSGVGAAAGGGAPSGRVPPTGKTGTNTDAGNWRSPPPSESLWQGTPSQPLGTADQGPKSFNPMGGSGIWDALAALRATQTGGMQQGTAGFSASRAAQSMIPAAAGAVANMFTNGPGGSLVANAIQGQTIGQIYGPAMGVSAQSLYAQMPAGQLVQGPGDYAQGNYYAISHGMAGSNNFSTVQKGAIGGMALAPYLSYQGAVAAEKFSNQQLNAANRVGLNLQPFGQIQGTQQSMAQIFNRMTMGRPVTSWDQFQQGLMGPIGDNLASIGILPGSDQYNQFVAYASTAIKMHGQPMPDLTKPAGQKAAGLDTSALKQTQAVTAKSRLEQAAEPTLARAASDLSQASTALLNAATALTGGLPGGMGGLLTGGALPLMGGSVALGIGRKLFPGALQKVGGKVLGGALSQKWGFTKLAGRGLSKLPGLGRLFGGGAGEAAAAGGAEAGAEAGTMAAAGGLEAAGITLDATGVGLPIGLGLAAAGGLLAFHKPIGHAISSVWHGLFGGGHKKSAAGTAGTTGDPATDDLMNLLQAKPPKGSLIDLLTQPGTAAPGGGSMVGAPAAKHHKGLFGSLGQLAKGLPGIGGMIGAGESLLSGGGIQGALGSMMSSLMPFQGLSNMMGGMQGVGSALVSFLGGSPAASQTLGTPYAWNARTKTFAGIDLSFMFKANPQTQSQTSGNTTGSSGNTGGGTPVDVPPGGDYTPTTWAQQLLRSLGAPVTDANVQSLVNWETREGGHWHNPDKYNPLNTTKDMPGAVTTNSAGVKSYTSWQQGLQATVETLKNGLYNDLVAAFDAGQGLSHGHYASLAKWSDGGYDSLARGTQLVARTQLALLHRGEAVVPAADNYSSGAYNRNGAMGGGGAPIVQMNFRQGSITLQVSNNPSQQEMENIAKQFVSAISKPQILAAVRST